MYVLNVTHCVYTLLFKSHHSFMITVHESHRYLLSAYSVPNTWDKKKETENCGLIHMHFHFAEYEI